MYRHPVVLTTVEEDFRRIGLLPPLNESQLSEVDDPSKPRDIPSPDPDTLAGLDSSGGDKSANSKTARQPKPKMGPADDDSDVMDPLEDGGSKGAHKGKGSYKATPGSKEASIKGESRMGPKGYMLAKKQPALKGKGKNKGTAPQMAQGLKPAKKIGGMHKTSKGARMESTGAFAKTASLIEEVEGLLRGVQMDEAVDNLMRGFRLVSEDASLLADRLTELSNVYHVEKLVDEMEDLSRAAVEAIDIVETEMSNVGDDGDEDKAIKNSAASEYEHVEDMDETEEETTKGDHDSEKPYDIPSPAFKEQVERVFGAMVTRLMDALESYDAALDECGGDQEEGALGAGLGALAGGALGGPAGAAAGGMAGHELSKDGDEDEDEEDPQMAADDDGEGDDGEDGDVDGAHVHVHHHQDVHHHHHAGDDEGGEGDDAAMSSDAQDDDGDREMSTDPDQDGDDDSSDQGDTDHDRHDLMAKMHALKSKRDSMMGSHKPPFRKGGEAEGGAY